MNFSEGQRVRFDCKMMSGKGIIRGVSLTYLEFIGATYIVEVTDGQIPNDTYPFSCVSVAEIFLTLMHDFDDNEPDIHDDFPMELEYDDWKHVDFE